MSRGLVLALILGLICVHSPVFAACDDIDGPLQTDDCDEDGYSPADGDCDDDDAAQSPALDEVCDDGLDNNCDGAVDEGCGEDLPEGRLMGGSSCGQSGGGLAFIAPLFFVVRRRRC